MFSSLVEDSAGVSFSFSSADISPSLLSACPGVCSFSCDEPSWSSVAACLSGMIGFWSCKVDLRSCSTGFWFGLVSFRSSLTGAAGLLGPPDLLPGLDLSVLEDSVSVVAE